MDGLPPDARARDHVDQFPWATFEGGYVLSDTLLRTE